LSANGNFVSIVWQDGSSNSTYTVQNAGLYFVNVIDSFGCMASDSVNIAYYPQTQINVEPSVYLCNDSLRLAAGGLFSAYLWSNGATTESTFVSALGVYYITVTDQNGCTASDSVDVLSCDTNQCGGHYF